MRRSPIFCDRYYGYPVQARQGPSFYHHSPPAPAAPPSPAALSPARRRASVINIPVQDGSSSRSEAPLAPANGRHSPRTRPSLDAASAATKIQASFRGFSVRRRKPLLHLRTIASVSRELDGFQSALQSPDLVDKVRYSEKERLRLSESVMALLLRLDAIQGTIPEVISRRRETARKAVRIQDAIDDIVNGGSSNVENAGNKVLDQQVDIHSEGHQPVKRDGTSYDGTCPMAIDENPVEELAHAPVQHVQGETPCMGISSENMVQEKYPSASNGKKEIMQDDDVTACDGETVCMANSSKDVVQDSDVMSNDGKLGITNKDTIVKDKGVMATDPTMADCVRNDQNNTKDSAMAFDHEHVMNEENSHSVSNEENSNPVSDSETRNSHSDTSFDHEHVINEESANPVSDSDISNSFLQDRKGANLASDGVFVDLSDKCFADGNAPHPVNASIQVHEDSSQQDSAGRLLDSEMTGRESIEVENNNALSADYMDIHETGDMKDVPVESTEHQPSDHNKMVDMINPCFEEACPVECKRIRLEGVSDQAREEEPNEKIRDEKVLLGHLAAPSSEEKCLIQQLSEECKQMKSLLGQLLIQNSVQNKAITALGDRLEKLERQQRSKKQGRSKKDMNKEGAARRI